MIHDADLRRILLEPERKSNVLATAVVIAGTTFILAAIFYVSWEFWVSVL